MIDGKQQRTQSEFALRYKVALLAFLLLFGVLAFRAIELAIASPLPKSVLEQAQKVRRGVIFDARGHELAISRDTVSVGIKPLEARLQLEGLDILARVTGTPKAELVQKIKTSDKFFYLKRKMPLEEAAPLRKLDLAGLVLQNEPDRYYPNQKLASQIIGFTGLDGEGLSGIEFSQNQTLSHLRTDSQDFIGQNVHLTINSYVQHQLEKTLAAGLEDSMSKHAMGVIIESQTGKILAMSSQPDFDPNQSNKFPEENWKNLPISFQYEPGSTFKIFTMAALLRENLLNANQKYNCPGYFDYKGRRVSCTREHGIQDFTDVMKNSCNFGVITASWQLPVLKLYENLKAFGIGTLSEIQLPGEARGYLASPKDWDYYLKMSIPIGHGVSVTPLQLALAANAIANDGKLMPPMIIDKVSDAQGRVIERFVPQEKYRVASVDNAQQIRRTLREVVKSGTGAGADLGLKEFDVCGKTGTSIKSTRKGYDAKKYQASFVGFFPCEKPEITIMLMFDEPRGEYHQGATVAAPAFRRVLREIIPAIHVGEVSTVKPLPTPQYQSVASAPRPAPGDKNTMPDFRGFSKKELLFQVLSKFPGDHQVNGAGYVVQQSPEPGAKINAPYSFNFKLGFPDE
ncbi:penicillin-binding transpeptidase domain-containing protein [Turneriella parva]|uniref:Penicillin-binding protein transpeptidase n=1 Tax=Turneriella parva (strain ATCC BAA-1111 / DSM 21527 / NCTC 11395 / H) TaxID=869212 RepID=I4BBU5_TURPD|nr:penicillin-binding transpeptidase domain-containing protein [Turneriella parva]AFM14752.1 penicillin-binding protein transpeptidase [Turneriella parva DSM 21527]